VVIEGSARKTGKEEAEPAAVPRHGLFTNMALFLSAPFVGLLYAVLLPFVGLAMLAWFAGKTLYESGKVHQALRIGRRIAVIAASPIVGLVYLIALPFAGLGMLTWIGATALMAPAPVK
jgi:hypothetical protein